MDDFQVPRCGHGNIILGCPNDACPEQNDYLAHQNDALDAWYVSQQAAARRFVRTMLGMDPDS